MPRHFNFETVIPAKDAPLEARELSKELGFRVVVAAMNSFAARGYNKTRQ